MGKNKRAKESDESTRRRGGLMRVVQVREKILGYKTIVKPCKCPETIV